jgi:predicted DNA-binding protein YlxM (UPF0122 family)
MSIKDLLFDGDKFSLAKAAGLATAAGGIYAALKPGSSVGEFFGGKAQQPIGYTGGIPEYEVSRALQPDAFSATTPTGEARAPGSMGRQYFTPTTFTPTDNVMSPAIGPVDTQTQETAKAQGIIDSLPEDVIMGLLQSMFGGGGIPTPGGETGVGTGTGVPTPGAGATLQTELQTFLTPFYNKQLTTEDLQSLADSEFPLSELAKGLKVSEAALQAAITRATTTTTPTQTKLQTFLTPFYNKQLTPEDLKSLAGSGYSVSELAKSLKVSEAALQAAITRATTTSTDPNTVTIKDQTPLPSTGAGVDQTDELAELIGDGTFVGPIQTPAPTPTPTPTPTTSAKLSSVEQLLVQNYGYIDNGDGTLTDPNGSIYDTEQGGVISGPGANKYAQGGNVSAPQSRGYYLGGQTDGMADQIPATIEGTQPAKLSDGEFVVPADIVSHLGNGNSDAGAKQLYSMMDRVRQARTGQQEQGRKIAPNDYLPG